MNLKDARLVLNAKCKIVMFTSVIVLWQTTYSSPCRLYLYASLQVMKKYLKLRKHALKTSTSFSSPWRTSHYSANASSFLMNSFMALSKTRVSNARGSPHGTQMPSPGAAIKLQMPHPPGLTMWANTPRLPGGGGWALLELTHALRTLHCETYFSKTGFSEYFCLFVDSWWLY